MATLQSATAALQDVKLAWDPVWNALRERQQLLSVGDLTTARDVETRVNEFISYATQTIAAASAATGAAALVFQTQLGSVVSNAATLKQEIQTLRVRLTPVLGADVFVAPKSTWEQFSPLIKTVLVVGAGYMLYRWGKEIFSDVYPRSKLPRYAGGSR